MSASILETQAPAFFAAAHLAVVESVEDTENMGRVKIRLLAFDGVTDQDGPIWARVAVPFAGKERGAFFIPDVGDEVVVTFLNGDSRFPVVVGSLWNGGAKTKEKIGGKRVDRWTITGRAGTRIAIVEKSKQEATVSFTTPGGASGTITDASGGKIEFKNSSGKITIDSKGVSIETTLKVKIKGGAGLEIQAASVKVDSMMSEFKGFIKCQGVEATTVMGKSYTPGAGNVW